MMRNVQMNGFLVFEDAGQKFITGKHALIGLTKDCDIFVYSLTPQGHEMPQHLVMKAAPAGKMFRKDADGKFKGELFDPSEIDHVVLKRMDYQKGFPRNLFEYVRDLPGDLARSIRNGIKVMLKYQDGAWARTLTLEEFFDIDFDIASKELGAQSFLKDKAYYLRQK